MLRELGEVRKKRAGFKLYECCEDGTFSKAKSGGNGIGCTKVGKGVKFMIIVDAKGLPVAVNTGSVYPHHNIRKPENLIQDGRPLRRYKRRWTVERTIAWH